MMLVGMLYVQCSASTFTIMSVDRVNPPGTSFRTGDLIHQDITIVEARDLPCRCDTVSSHLPETGAADGR